MVQNVGTSNPIVARVLLQGDQVLNFFTGTETEKAAIRKQLHQCKELLLRCEASANQVRSKIEAIKEKVKLAGIPLEKGRVLNPFPHVENLEADCSTFLVDRRDRDRLLKVRRFECKGQLAILSGMLSEDNSCET
jgi:hypothetical protein